MTTELSLNLVGAQVLLAEGLSDADLSVRDGLICDVAGTRTIDLSGYLVLPGIVDLHGDGFERHLAPRRGAMKQMAEASPPLKQSWRQTELQPVLWPSF